MQTGDSHTVRPGWSSYTTPLSLYKRLSFAAKLCDAEGEQNLRWQKSCHSHTSVFMCDMYTLMIYLLNDVQIHTVEPQTLPLLHSAFLRMKNAWAYNSICLLCTTRSKSNPRKRTMTSSGKIWLFHLKINAALKKIIVQYMKNLTLHNPGLRFCTSIHIISLYPLPHLS